MHDLDPGALHRKRGAHDRPHLHLVDLGIEDAQPAAAGAQHRVDLAQRLDPRGDPLLARAELLQRGQELVQGRVEQPDRDRVARHRPQDALEVGLLERQQPVERAAAAGLVGGHDHLAHHGEPLVAEEHVLGAAQADPLGAELARPDRILGRVGVRAHPEPADLVGPCR